MTRDRSDAVIVQWRPPEGRVRRQRFEPHSDGGHVLYTEVRTPCGWHVEGDEAVSELVVESGDWELAADQP